MNLKCGYFTVGGIMCGSLVGIFVGALAVNASLGYMILLLGAWGLCLYITSHSLMDDARREEAVLNQPAEEFDDPDELPPLYWEGYDRGYEAWPTPARRVCGHPRARKKVLSLTTPLRADARTLMQPPGWARVSSPGKCRERKECSCEKRRLGKGQVQTACSARTGRFAVRWVQRHTCQ